MTNSHQGTTKTMAFFIRDFVIEAIINCGLGVLYGSLAIIGAAILFPASIGYVIFALTTLIVTVSSEETVEPTNRADVINDITRLTARETRQYSIVITFSTAAGISLITFVAGTGATLIAMGFESSYLAIIFAVGYPVLDRSLSDVEPRASLIAIGFRTAVEGYRILQKSRHATNHNFPEEVRDIKTDNMAGGDEIRFEMIGEQARSSGPLF